MGDNNLIQILKSLSKKEMKEFELFVNSPFFNKNKNLIRLLDEMKLYYPLFSTTPDMKSLHQQIYPQMKFSEPNMKTLFHLLTRLLEKYMIYVQNVADTANSKNRLLEAFYFRKLGKQFIKYEKQLSASYAGLKGTDTKVLNEKIDFEHVRRNYYIDMNEEEKIYRHELKYGEHKITLFFIELFALYNSLKRLKYLNFDVGFDFVTEMISNINFDKMIGLFKKNSFEDTPVIETYYKMYKALSEPENDAHFEEFRRSLLENSEYISKSEQYLLSTLLVSCSYYRQAIDRVKYTPEMFESYKILLSLYEYSGDIYLRSHIYSSVLRLGIQLKEFEWLEEYIKVYSELLQPEHKENMRHYSNAYLAFIKNDFEKSLGFISKIDFTNFQMKYHMRNLQLMIYYELSDYESSHSFMDAYKHFIRKEKNFSKSLKDGYLSFIESVHELQKIKTGAKPFHTKELKEKILNSNPMRKPWLLEKIEELENV